MMNLLSDQVDKKEIDVIIRELSRVLDKHIPGDVVEFGCYVGTTSVYIAKTLMDRDQDKQFYVYDSFEGLPDKTVEDTSPLGLQFKPGELLASKKQFIKNLTSAKVPMPKIKKAWFCDLNPDDVPQKIVFAFLDGDYYASIADPLKLISSRLQPGATVIIDDYGNDALPGASKAVNEWLVTHAATKKIEQSLAILYMPQ